MIERKQLYRHAPTAGTVGDCHRTAIACLLDLEPVDVPHFGFNDFDFASGKCVKHNQAAEADAWLAERGLGTVSIAYEGSGSLEGFLNLCGSMNPHAYFLFGGTSKTGVNHTVIARGNQIVWDPSLDDAGIVGPCDDSYYWITFIVPLFMIETNHED